MADPRLLLLLVCGCTFIDQTTFDERHDLDRDGVLHPDDCDDSDATVFPGADEVCDGVDNDCDGEVDEVDGTGSSSTMFPDADGDGFGDANSPTPVTGCDVPAGLIVDGTDCDDASPAVNPGASEVECDSIDNDCDAATADGPDGDGDGATACVDCDDTDPLRFPGNPEVCGDGIDNDCDGSAADPPSMSADFETDPTPVMSLNGPGVNYYMYSNILELTVTLPNLASTAIFRDSVDGDNFGATFDLNIAGDPYGHAEGAVFAVIDGTDPTVVGDTGAGLGVRGLSGWGVEFDHAFSAGVGDPDDNHIAVVNLSDLSVIASATPPFQLFGSGSHLVEISVVNGTVDVVVDGLSQLSAAVPSIPSALVGFGASTGPVDFGFHDIDNVEIGCP